MARKKNSAVKQMDGANPGTKLLLASKGPKIMEVGEAWNLLLDLRFAEPGPKLRSWIRKNGEAFFHRVLADDYHGKATFLRSLVQAIELTHAPATPWKFWLLFIHQTRDELVRDPLTVSEIRRIVEDEFTVRIEEADFRKELKLLGIAFRRVKPGPKSADLKALEEEPRVKSVRDLFVELRRFGMLPPKR